MKKTAKTPATKSAKPGLIKLPTKSLELVLGGKGVIAGGTFPTSRG